MMSGQAASASGTSAPCLGSSTDVATAFQSRAATTTRGPGFSAAMDVDILCEMVVDDGRWW